MKANMGTFDRRIRFILGPAIGAAGLYFKSWYGLIGLVPLTTAFVGSCPLYIPFGISTRRMQSERSST
jgi:hypothetical protein